MVRVEYAEIWKTGARFYTRGEHSSRVLALQLRAVLPRESILVRSHGPSVLIYMREPSADSETEAKQERERS